MNIFLGTDICEISRVETAINKYSDKFLNKIFTTEELDYCLNKSKNKFESLSARFATKEAVAKALGSGLNGLGWNNGVDWKEIELKRNAIGNLSLNLTGKAKRIEQEKNINNWAVSIAHSRNDAISTVIGYSNY